MIRCGEFRHALVAFGFSIFVALCSVAPVPILGAQLPQSFLSFPSTSSFTAGEVDKYLTKEVIHDRVPDGTGYGKEFLAHMYTARDPFHHFSVLPPRFGCGTLSTPKETADDHVGGCDVATNGGLFVPGDDVEDHACIGPLVSDGTWQHDEWRQNVFLGILMPKPGDITHRYFVGYMNESEMAHTKWAQLVSGCFWLVRDSQSFVSNSTTYEDATSQTTGSLSKFRDILAPRLSIGFTREGKLLMVAVDGSEPDWEGLSLGDLATVMIGLGAVQAINLDGGGSLSVYERDELVNFPSDVCPNTTFPKFRCARPVSSVMCLHSYHTPKPSSSHTRVLRSHTILPSMTTVTISTSRHHMESEEDGSGTFRWLRHATLTSVVIFLAKIAMAVALFSWIAWQVRSCVQSKCSGDERRWRQAHAVDDDDEDEGEEDNGQRGNRSHRAQRGDEEESTAIDDDDELPMEVRVDRQHAINH